LLLGYGGEAAEIVLYAFDLLMFRGKDVRRWPLEERRGHLFEIARLLPASIRAKWGQIDGLDDNRL